jgi:hypothetical protein
MSCTTTPIALQGVATATLQIWLGQAQQAMQDLMTGRRATTVSYSQGEGSRSVTYTRTNIADLRAWIQELQIALNPAAPQFRRRPIYPRF